MIETHGSTAGGAVREPDWASLPDKKLLDLRFCELDLEIAGTTVELRIQQLRRELGEIGLRFRPYFWVSVDWFTPDGIPGCAVPFYVLHPRLAELERSQMGEVEGGTPEWCMRILRHEAGHAIDNAYNLRRRRRRQQLFGKSTIPYPDCYEPRPYSRRYVQHLEPWYAQSHPDEDFAETFAVWMTPHSSWRQRYPRWPAYKKLEYMDELMGEIARKPATVRRRKSIEPLVDITTTLAEHYDERRKRYGPPIPTFYDANLRKLFRVAVSDVRGPGSADHFIARIEGQVTADVARWTGEYKYIVKRVVTEIRQRCRHLALGFEGDPEEAQHGFALMLTAHTMRFLHNGRHREWL